MAVVYSSTDFAAGDGDGHEPLGLLDLHLLFRPLVDGIGHRDLLRGFLNSDRDVLAAAFLL